MAESSGALTKRSIDTELMPPPAKRVKRPQKVLDEETYVSGISEIIARDFFPGLLETETQQEYLDALESRDKLWISSARSRLSQIMTTGRRRGRRGTSMQAPINGLNTPVGYGVDTPMSTISNISTESNNSERNRVANTNMGLDVFQATYTSEDNESFYRLVDKQNQKRAEKYSWMWRGNMLPSDRLLKQKEVEERLLNGRGSLSGKETDRSRIVTQDPEHKPTIPDSWKFQPSNSLMFKADGVEDYVETVAQKAQAKSRAAPKGIVHSNTRIPQSAVFTQQIAPSSPSLSAVRDAISRHPRRNDSESESRGNETPRINGYAFVDDEPEPQEYAELGSTIVFEKGDGTKNPFKIRERSKREDLHHRMVDRVATTNRVSTKIGMTGKINATPLPKFPSSPRVGVGALTPAAQRLWTKVGSSSSTMSPLASKDYTPCIVKHKKSKLKIGWTPK